MRTRRRANTFCAEEIFDTERCAFQNAALAFRAALIGRRGHFEGLVAGHNHIGVQRHVGLLDIVQKRRRKFDRRK